jgi:hypothetical protein
MKERIEQLFNKYVRIKHFYRIPAILKGKDLFLKEVVKDEIMTSLHLNNILNSIIAEIESRDCSTLEEWCEMKQSIIELINKRNV